MTIKPGLLYNIVYECPTCDDAGEFMGYWTGEQDLTGKLTFEPIEGVEDTYYLFPHELIEVWPVYSGQSIDIGAEVNTNGSV